MENQMFLGPALLLGLISTKLNNSVAFTSLFPSCALLPKATTPHLNTPVFGAERGKEKKQPSAEKWSIQQATARAFEAAPGTLALPNRNISALFNTVKKHQSTL